MTNRSIDDLWELKDSSIQDSIRGRDGIRPAFFVDTVSGCWICSGPDQGDGYSMLAGEPAHRHAYKKAIGEIVAGYQIHHLCGVRNCIYPAHLIAVSRADHARIHNYERRLAQ